MATIVLIANDLLTLVETVGVERPNGLNIGIVNQALTIQQFVEVVSNHPYTEDVITFSQDVSINYTRNLSLSDFLPLGQSGRKVTEVATSSFLPLSQSAYNFTALEAGNILALSQTIQASRGLNNVFAVVDEATFNIVKTEQVTQTLLLAQGVSVFVTGYYYYLGVTISDSYDPSLLQIPSLPASPLPVTLTYGTQVITFRNIDYGNTDSIEHTRVNQRSRGGDLILYRDPRWPKTEILTFKATNMSESTAQALLAFLNISLARPIELRDYEGVKWTGFIINPDLEIIQITPDRPCGGYEAEIKFQGVQHA